VLRVGSVRPRPIDVRFLSATNRDLDVESAAGRFRRDLFFRLNAVTFRVPPLRDRSDEIEPLARVFIAKAARDHGHAAPRLTAEVLDFLRRYPWPGNIRELKNVIERGVLLAGETDLSLAHLPMQEMLAAMGARTAAAGIDDRQRILDALESCAGNQTRAAEMLGISRRTLVQRLSDYQLPRPRKR
jgi:two-component system, NtrC family, response regulator AtoC